MDPAKFTRNAQMALAQAHQKAFEDGHTVVRPEHLLLALVAEEDVTLALADYLVDVAGLKDALRYSLAGVGQRPQDGRSFLDPSREMESLLADVWQRVRSSQRRQIQVTDLVIGLLDESSRASVVSKLPNKGLKLKDLERGLIEHAPSRGSKPADGLYRNLRTYSRCLTDLARSGVLDPVIGRHHEVRRVMQILGRREKNSPLLVGPVGIGKTSVILALAQRIAADDVPEALRGADIFALDVSILTSGAEFRGMLEERVKTIIAEVRDARGKGIIFIDDIAALFRRGSNTGDIGALLRPALATGDLRIIGVTTLDEYRQHVERDAPMDRRFQVVRMQEPTVDETVSILRGVKKRYEAHHELGITDRALQAAVALSHRFVQDRMLPDKAIDLLDEAAAKVRIEWDTLPLDVDTAKRRIAELTNELIGMDGDQVRAGAKFTEELERLKAVVRLTDMERGTQATLARTILDQRQRMAWGRMVACYHGELGWSRNVCDMAERSLARDRAALDQDETALGGRQVKRRVFKVEIDEEDIAEVVSGWTGIPLSKLMEDERAKLLDMEHALHERVVGQHEAIVAVSNAVRLARAGMKDPGRPVGSFLFLGPTGVGKTELCRALAEFLFDDEAAMVRIDMSEYMDKHTVSRLVGAPPGYIGYEDSGQLTEALRGRPYSVVLFDEIEKAHQDVFNILLQIMEDGRLTDGHGRTVDFKSALVTMTSNVGGHLYREHLEGNKGDLRERLMSELRASFRPEFLNRLDAIVFFDLLTKEQIKEIVDIQVRTVNRRLAGGEITLEVDGPAKSYLAAEGYDILQGARPLKRLIQQKVLEPLAMKVLKGELTAGDVIVIGMMKGEQELQLKRVAGAPAVVPAGGRALPQKVNGVMLDVPTRIHADSPVAVPPPAE